MTRGAIAPGGARGGWLMTEGPPAYGPFPNPLPNRPQGIPATGGRGVRYLV